MIIARQQLWEPVHRQRKALRPNNGQFRFPDGIGGKIDNIILQKNDDLTKLMTMYK